MEFLKDLATSFTKEVLSDWPLGTIIGVILIACVLALIGLALWGLCVAADSWFLPKERGMGRVVGKTFTPAHTEMVLIYNAATKTSMPPSVHHPDDWSVNVEVQGKQDDISIAHKFYDSLSKGSSVSAEFVHGRFSGNLYLKKIDN